jgi:hypothetical protein
MSRCSQHMDIHPRMLVPLEVWLNSVHIIRVCIGTHELNADALARKPNPEQRIVEGCVGFICLRDRAKNEDKTSDV